MINETEINNRIEYVNKRLDGQGIYWDNKLYRFVGLSLIKNEKELFILLRLYYEKKRFRLV